MAAMLSGGIYSIMLWEIYCVLFMVDRLRIAYWESVKTCLWEVCYFILMVELYRHAYCGLLSHAYWGFITSCLWATYYACCLRLHCVKNVF